MGGYDTRVDYRGEAYIVQTQDKGLGAQYIESLIYKAGRLLTSKRAFYTAFLGLPDAGDRIERMMEEQHKTILGQIVEGRYD
ncbi:MAG: hypothetical protein ACXWGZ_00975 [Candidatus Aminicenantales bacterium]